MAIFIVSIFLVPAFFKDKIEVPADFSSKLDNVKVIICGDSRADRQIDPSIVHQKTGYDVLNMAATSQDLYTWSNSLVAANVSDKIIIISASFFQINDGANDFSFFNVGTFSAMTFSDKLRLYRGNPTEIILMQTKLAYGSVLNKTHKEDFGNYHRKVNMDFHKKECNSFKISSKWFKGHWWYKGADLNGVKHKYLEKAFERLSKLKNCLILIYNGPVSESFLKHAAKTDVLNLERNYNQILNSLCNKYNFKFISFIDDRSLQNDNLYYDPQHLCLNGAQLFSEKISKIIDSLNQSE